MSWDRKITIKTADELAVMRMAGRINAEALDAAFKAIHPGATTADLNAAAEDVLKKYDVFSPFKNYPGPYPYPASTNVSVNNELVHGIPGKRKLKKGDIVSVDCGTVYEGFVGDSAFTAAVGDVDEDTWKLLKVTEQCLYAGIAKMVAGNHVGDISSTIQNAAEQNGFEVTREYTGHGVGRNMHQGPQVPNYGIAGRGLKLRTGIVLALEPMLLVDTAYTKVESDQWTVVSTNGKLTSHWEHTVAVTDTGPIILTLLEDGSSPGQISGRLEQ